MGVIVKAFSLDSLNMSLKISETVDETVDISESKGICVVVDVDMKEHQYDSLGHPHARHPRVQY